MILLWEQVQAVVNDNPNKGVVETGKLMADKLMMHVHGVGLSGAIKQCKHFVSDEIYAVQKEYAISNKDVFGRLLQQEDMVFTARGGSSHFGLSESEENQMNEMLDNVRYEMNLRKWVSKIALQAYRCDPMGIILMEKDPLVVDASGRMNMPKAYPTYKSIYCIYDYAFTGRKLEYVCFRLTVGECDSYGIEDPSHKGQKKDAKSHYYRLIDDAKDIIVQQKEGTVILTTNIRQINPIVNQWGRTPGFVISDLIKFNDQNCFVSPLAPVVELADCFLNDRSVRDLQKKYHGFAKAVEPLLQCRTCDGTGLVQAEACPSCTPKGAVKGTGFNLRTKVSDVARFPLSMFETSFDFNRIFGYVSPDIKGWEKQDASLEDIEELMEMTYWGTIRMKRPKPGTTDQPDTATEVKSNDAPKEARLNMTADWAESTENKIADFIGQYWFTAWKKSSISYGRDYILKTADELMKEYQDMRTKGAPDFTLDEALEKYYKAKYQNNPVQMVKFLKMLDVEPFPHMRVTELKGIVTDFNEFNCKLYFGEWCNTVPEAKWIVTPAPKLREELKAYVEAKGLKEPEPEPTKPAF